MPPKTPRTEATTFRAVVGFNVPDPSGERDEAGRPKEVRFEAGAVVNVGDVSAAALETLRANGIVVDPTAKAN